MDVTVHRNGESYTLHSSHVTPYAVSTLFLVRQPALRSDAAPDWTLANIADRSQSYFATERDQNQLKLVLSASFEVLGEPYHVPDDPKQAALSRQQRAAAKRRLLAEIASKTPGNTTTTLATAAIPSTTRSTVATPAAPATNESNKQSSLSDSEEGQPHLVMCHQCGVSFPAANAVLHEVRCQGKGIGGVGRHKQHDDKENEENPAATSGHHSVPCAAPTAVAVTSTPLQQNRWPPESHGAVASRVSVGSETTSDDHVVAPFRQPGGGLAGLAEALRSPDVAASPSPREVDAPQPESFCPPPPMEHVRAMRMWDASPDTSSDRCIALAMRAAFAAEAAEEDAALARALEQSLAEQRQQPLPSPHPPPSQQQQHRRPQSQLDEDEQLARAIQESLDHHTLLERESKTRIQERGGQLWDDERFRRRADERPAPSDRPTRTAVTPPLAAAARPATRPTRAELKSRCREMEREYFRERELQHRVDAGAVMRLEQQPARGQPPPAMTSRLPNLAAGTATVEARFHGAQKDTRGGQGPAQRVLGSRTPTSATPTAAQRSQPVGRPGTAAVVTTHGAARSGHGSRGGPVNQS